MAIKQKQIDYSDAADNIAVLLVTIITQIKAKQSVGQIVAQSLEPLMAAVQTGADLSADLQANRKAVEETIGYRLGDIVDALIAA